MSCFIVDGQIREPLALPHLQPGGSQPRQALLRLLLLASLDRFHHLLLVRASFLVPVEKAEILEARFHQNVEIVLDVGNVFKCRRLDNVETDAYKSELFY